MKNKLSTLLFSAYLLFSPIEATAGKYLDKAKLAIKAGNYSDARFLLEEELKEPGNKEAYVELAKLTVYENLRGYPVGAGELEDFGRRIIKTKEDVADILRKAQLLGYKGSLEDIFLDTKFVMYDRKLTKSDNNLVAEFFTFKRFSDLKDILEESIFSKYKQTYEKHGRIFDLSPFCYIITTEASDKYRVLFFGKDENSIGDFYIKSGRISRVIKDPQYETSSPKLCK